MDFGKNSVHLWKSNIRSHCVRNKLQSHSSTESEVVSLDAGLHMDGIPALDRWDLVIEVLDSSLSQPSIQGNLCDTEQSRKRTNTRTKLKLRSVSIMLQKRKTFSLRHIASHF